jgi:hypothetical protein
MKRTKPPSAKPSQLSGRPLESTEKEANEPSEPASPSKRSSNQTSSSEATPHSVSNSQSLPKHEPPLGIPPSESLPLGLVMLDPVNASAAKSKRGAEPNSKKPHTAIPPILLEGDEPEPAPDLGPDQKFASSSKPESAEPQAGPSELPEAYGTGRLLVTARDPSCLYVHWDLTADQQQGYINQSADHQLIVRVRRETAAGSLVSEVPISPASRHSFIPVAPVAGKYVAELGYYPPGNPWKMIAVSEVAAMTVAATDPDQGIRFATLRFTIPPPTIPVASTPSDASTVSGPSSKAPTENLSPDLRTIEPPLLPLSHSREVTLAPPDQVLAAFFPPFSETEPAPLSAVPQFSVADIFGGETSESNLLPTPVPEWSPARERALAELIDLSLTRHEWIGSAEIEELIRAEIRRPDFSKPGEVPSIQAVAMPQPLSSLGLGEAAPREGRNFWLNVNAELVIYGSSAPDAQVTIGGRPIRLRPDGTFSYRFALPDGSYRLPVTAVSPDGDLRQAELDFYRGTAYFGEVGSHPQDASLTPPS